MLWANVVITAVFDHLRTVRGFLKVTRDDTHRREAERQARELELLVERERLPRELNDAVIHRIFVAGLAMERIRSSLHDEELKDRVDTAVAELDQAIRELRLTLFDVDAAEHDR